MRVEQQIRVLALLAADLAIFEGGLVAHAGNEVLGVRRVRVIAQADAVEQVGLRLAGDFELAALGLQRVLLGVGDERSVAQEGGVLVALLAFHLVTAVGDKLIQAHTTGLSLALDAPLLKVGLGDGDKRHVLAGVVVRDNRGARDAVEERLLRADRVDRLRVNANSLHDQGVDLDVSLRFEQRLGDLREAEQELAVGSGKAAGNFPLGGDGQHDVGIHRLRGHELGLCQNEVHLAMRLDAALHVRAGLQVGVLVMDDAVDVARAILASLRALAGVPVADHTILAGQARFPHLRSGDDAIDLVLLARITRAATLHQGGAAITSVCMVVVRGAVAGLAHMTAHSAQRHEQLRNVLARIAASGGEVMEQPHVLLLADFACEPGDFLNGDAADSGRPLGVVLHAVVLSFQIVDEVNVFLQVFGLVLSIETDGVLVQELPVNNVTLSLVQADHLGSDAQQERRVGASADGNPLGIEHLGRSRVNRVDSDELDARFLSADVVIARRAGGRPCGIRRVKHDGVGVQHVGAVVAHACVGARNADGVGGVQKVGAMRRGVRGAGVSTPCQKRRKREARTVASQQECLVAVLFLDGLELVADVADGLIPADALPFILAAHLAVRVIR